MIFLKKHFINISIFCTIFAILILPSFYSHAEMRTKTITEYWTSDWVEFKSDVNPPSVIEGEYYDSKTGQYIEYTAKKSGDLYRIDSKVNWIYWHSPGSAQWYDKERNYYLGFMSNNPYTYYAGRFDDPNPGEAPDRYYGIPRNLVDNEWELIDYGWDEPEPVNADEWAAKGNQDKLVYHNGSYWWRSESGILNKYRKGVWIDYRLKVNLYKYRQKYTVTITLPDEDPPEHREAAVSSHKYKDGSTYWTTPNDSVNIRLRGFDEESLIDRNYLALRGNGVDARVRHDWYWSDTNRYDYYRGNTNHIDYTNARRSYESSDKRLREVTFTAIPRTHGHIYDIRYFYRDRAGNYSNNNAYGSTGLRLGVDGVAPTHVSNSINGARYVNGNDYWIQPGDTVYVNLRQRDPHSGNKYQYLRLYGSGVDLRGRHTFADNKDNQKTVVDIGTGADILGSNRTENTTYGRVNWTVKAKKHGHNYSIQYYFTDNVGNTRGYKSTGKRLRVDGLAPSVTFNPNSQGWTEGSITVNANISDNHSGVKRFRYRIYSNGTWSSYSSWINGDSKTFTIDDVGKNRIHIQAEDNVGNRKNVYSGYYYINNLPVADFDYTPKPAYEGDDILIINQSTDPDGHSMTAEWEITDPNGNIDMQTSWNAVIKKSIPGDYTITLTVTDEPGGTDTTTKVLSVNELDINGIVEHTDKWKDYHLEQGNSPNQFYSGEKFITIADVTDYPISKVHVEFAGELLKGDLLNINEKLVPNPHPQYTGEVFDEVMASPDNRLKNGIVYFVFTAEWANGTVKQDIVPVEIIGTALDQFDFYRSN